MINYDITPVIWKMEQVGGQSYFWDMYHNALFSYDGVHVQNIRLRCTDKRIIGIENAYFNGVYCKNGKLYFSSQKADFGMVYSLENNCEKYVEYPEEIKKIINNNAINAAFSKIIFDEQHAYYIGSEMPCVLVFDIRMEAFTKMVFFELEDFSFFKDAVVVGDAIYIAEGEHDRVVILHKDYSYDVKEFGKLRKGFSSICLYQASLFLVPRYDEPIIIWNTETDRTEMVFDYPEGFSFAKDGNREIAFSMLIDEKIYLFPAFASDVIFYDLERKCLCVDEIISACIKSEKENDEETTKCIFLEKYENTLVIQDGYSLCLQYFDYEKKEVKKEKLEFNENENAIFKISQMKNRLDDSEIMYESDEYNLKDYVRVIAM